MKNFAEFSATLLIMIVSCTISSIVFGILFNALDGSVLNAFGSIKRYASNLKRKRLIKNIFFISYIVASVTFKEIFNFNYVVLGLLIGFFDSLTNIIFDTKIHTNRKQSA